MVVARDADLYRPNVGLALFHASGRVFLGRRVGASGSHQWQMPQGGVDPGEDTHTAALRELEEEVGVRSSEVSLLQETPDWLYYDFPPELIARSNGNRRFIGQRQKWFAFRFLGNDHDIRLDLHTPEFSEWRWGELQAVPKLVIPFKRGVYQEVARRFAPYAAPQSAPLKDGEAPA